MKCILLFVYLFFKNVASFVLESLVDLIEEAGG